MSEVPPIYLTSNSDVIFTHALTGKIFAPREKLPTVKAYPSHVQFPERSFFARDQARVWRHTLAVRHKLRRWSTTSSWRCAVARISLHAYSSSVVRQKNASRKIFIAGEASFRQLHCGTNSKLLRDRYFIHAEICITLYRAHETILRKSGVHAPRRLIADFH